MNETSFKWDPILSFWFGANPPCEQVSNDQMERWFRKSSSTDLQISDQFGEWVVLALSGSFSEWHDEARGSLAKLILLDQFTRNIFRDTPKAFAGDVQALSIATHMLETGQTKELPPIMRVFCFLPFEHAESLTHQETSVLNFTKLRNEVQDVHKEVYENFLEYAIKHREVITRFGRFPHRNDILGRVSTAEEKEFLKLPGSRF